MRRYPMRKALTLFLEQLNVRRQRAVELRVAGLEHTAPCRTQSPCGPRAASVGCSSIPASP
jgi:hypothetical protein